MSFWPFFSTSYDHHCHFVVVECVLWCQLQFGSNESIKFNSNENDTRPNCTTKEMYGTEPKVKKKKKQADKTKKKFKKSYPLHFLFLISLSLSFPFYNSKWCVFLLSIYPHWNISIFNLSFCVCVFVSILISFHFSVLCVVSGSHQKRLLFQWMKRKEWRIEFGTIKKIGWITCEQHKWWKNWQSNLWPLIQNTFYIRIDDDYFGQTIHTHRHTETSKSQISIHAIVSGLSTTKGDRFDFLRCCCSIVVPYYHYHHHLVIVVELCNMKNWYKIYING